MDTGVDEVRVSCAFRAELWRWQARADTWVFVRLPQEESALVREVPRPPRGFGAVPVAVVCGSSRWRTSVFPESADGAYVLPVKAAVRRREGIDVGDEADFTLDVLG
ncbi:DUF1905 domain-containing protein [Kineococcus sp. SYSU DK006]|uniref:DUF1905 domain-containing protein n=1 Tax=Kineococcus sp. SYSU DK006 TaxID=3383127 RepID=UPI003D7D43E9